MRDMRFKVGERVRITSIDTSYNGRSLTHLIGKTGVIIGLSKDNDPFYYVVDLGEEFDYIWGDHELQRAKIKFDRDGNIW